MDKKSKGFTIIEVVLVLAIAGLIFIMVFIAMPALRRSQRDTQRDRNIQEIMAATDNYKAHNAGQLPGIKGCESGAGCNSLDSLNDFLDRYVIDHEDPLTAQKYDFVAASKSGDDCVATAKTVEDENAYHHLGFCYETTCGGDDIENADNFQPSDNVFVFTVIYRKESGGVVCRDNR